MQLETQLSLETILSSRNLAAELDERDRTSLAFRVREGYEMDRISRSEWERRMEAASKIALQVVEKKTFPWPDASNVKFPLITIAALQYHSRAYPALVPTPDLVRCAPVGEDPKGQKALAARTVGEHMSWQLTEEDPGWEEGEDKALLVQPIMGCVFKKTRFDSVLRHNVSELVLPQDIVVSYFTKSLDQCPRLTHVLAWTHNDLQERLRRKLILDTEGGAPRVAPMAFGRLQELRDKSQGITQSVDDPDQPYTILEQHLSLDLDGDGYKEPYVAWVRYDTTELLRLLPRFLPSGLEYEEVDGEATLVRIQAECFFTKIPFIPSPDGGFYDLGFGHLLGPLNESINTAINQLFDAGTMHNAGGGFLGRGFRSKKGEISFRPNEWKTVDAVGDDLRKSIVALPIREPSAVLFSLLSLLIDFGQRVAGAPEVTQGQLPGQNTPAETARNAMEQGIKVFSGIYKRTYRALKAEFTLLFRLNALHLPETKEFNSAKSGLPMKVLAKYYEMPSSAIHPAADPNYRSQTQRMNQANALMAAAHANPGYDLYKVNQFYLEAWEIPNRDEMLPDPKGPNAIAPTPDPKLQIEQLRVQAKQMETVLMLKMKLAELLEEHELNAAKIVEMHAEAAKDLAEAHGVGSGHEIARFQAAIGAAKLQQDGRFNSIKLVRELIESLREGSDGKGRVGGVEGGRGNADVLLVPSLPAAGANGAVVPGAVH